MQLVEAGKIDLDAPVQRYLPWFRVSGPEASARITVRHLLNQTSGLPGVPGMDILADLDERSDAAERQARAMSTLALTRAPGSEWEYSNLNYILLGLIIEAAGGESYADYVRRHIFAPLRMHHSYTIQSAAKRHGLAIGHRYWFAEPVAAPDLPTPRGSLAAGQLISSTEDLAHYLIAHLNGGIYKDAQLLSSAGVDELHRGVAECRALGETVGWYGMGWFNSDVEETRIVWHSGNVPDFSSFMALLPEQKRGLVLLLNADHYGLPIILAEVGLGAAALLAGQEPPPIKLGFIPWCMRALPLIPLLQLVGIVATLRRLRRWRQNPALRPNGGRAWARQILPSLMVNAGLAAVPIVLRGRGLLRFLKLFTPDAAWIALLSGSFAGVWAVLRTSLIVRALRGPQDPKPQKLEDTTGLRRI
jgi:CubicO group peptidase (beta-lactamase class C family)